MEKREQITKFTNRKLVKSLPKKIAKVIKQKGSIINH